MRGTKTPWIPWMATLALLVVGCARVGAEPQSHALEGDTIATSHRLAPGTRLAVAERPLPRIFRETTLFIAAGSSAGELSIPVDVTDETAIYLLPGGGDASIVRAARAELFLRGPATATLGVATSAATKELVSAQLSSADRPGEYRLSFGPVAAQNGLVVDVRLPRSPIAMALTASAHQVLLSDEAFVDVATTDDGAPVDGVTIEARLVTPSTHARGSLLPVVARGAGVMRISLGRALEVEGETGVHVVEVRATGTSHGRPFDRFGSVALHVGAKVARVISSTPRLVAVEGGDALEVDVDVDVATRDRLELSAVLVTNGDEQPRALANTTATLAPGAHRMTLRFDGPVDAGWALRNLRLYSIGSSTLLSLQ